MRTYFNLILSIFFIFSCTTENTNSKTIKNLHYLIKELSSDEMQGRNPGTEGAKITKNFIASEFKKNGLTPLGKTFFQEVPAVSSLVVDKSFFTISFRDQDKKFDYGSEVVFWSKRNKGEQIIRSSDLVFVGYGIVAPEYKWNDYAGVDVNCLLYTSPSPRD